jgi:hypothetical protein
VSVNFSAFKTCVPRPAYSHIGPPPPRSPGRRGAHRAPRRPRERAAGKTRRRCKAAATQAGTRSTRTAAAQGGRAGAPHTRQGGPQDEPTKAPRHPGGGQLNPPRGTPGKQRRTAPRAGDAGPSGGRAAAQRNRQPPHRAERRRAGGHRWRAGAQRVWGGCCPVCGGPAGAAAPREGREGRVCREKAGRVCRPAAGLPLFDLRACRADHGPKAGIHFDLTRAARVAVRFPGSPPFGPRPPHYEAALSGFLEMYSITAAVSTRFGHVRFLAHFMAKVAQIAYGSLQDAV